MTVNIAMWSGPRNISTAMMYAFGNRADTQCWDEPFYGFSLAHFGNDHPMRDAIVAANETDWDRLVTRCLAPPEHPRTVFYQKQMTHHMLPGFDRGWIGKVTNAFLIRAPERVLASYTRKWSDVDLRAIGFVQQAELFDLAAQRLGKAPPVVDADDLLADPPAMLAALCEACGIGFDPAMLSWTAGPKPFDGVWAPHWYNAAWASTGFGAPPSAPAPLPEALCRIAGEARPFYERLLPYRLQPGGILHPGILP